MAGRTGNLTANISIDKEGRKAWQCLGFAFFDICGFHGK